ncbi:unnamed protein product, partial [Discosporangium mesarthrocarpum]
RKVTAQKIKTAGTTGVLALQEHGLKEVPDEVFKVVNLRTLNLESNTLRSLPGAVTSLSKLKTLRVDVNKLESLPDLSALSALLDLSARDNRLEGANALGPLPPSLVKLSLPDNHLGGFPAAVLDGLVSLQVLDLSANGIRFVPASLSSALPALIELSLDSNTIQSLPAELSDLKKLKKISLKSNRIEAMHDGKQQSLARELFANSTVEVLELQGNPLTKPELMHMDDINLFLERRERNKNKNLQGGALLQLSVCGLD